MKKFIHGKQSSIGCRWCAVCKREHGILYPCEHYDEATLKEIKHYSDKLKNGEFEVRREKVVKEVCD